ncbi:MAG TPA: polysaccharide deacetylase family protein [Gemmatimonadaceae bacterium]
MRRSVPLLVTMDFEIANDHDLEDQRCALECLKSDLGRLGIPMTIFATSDAAQRFAPELGRLALAGHEIGCHGMTHAPDEDFRRMPESRTRWVIEEATRRIAIAVPRGGQPRCFRGPRMETSAVTQKVLVETGYSADFSVCPQRLDIGSCAGGSIAWLTAPRSAYRPDSRTPYRRGSVPLIVVPLSSIGFPFISGVLYLFGLRFMKNLFRALLAEAVRLDRPIVYLFHSYEFARWAISPQTARVPLHQRLYCQDRALRKRWTLELLEYALSFGKTDPMTGSRLVSLVGNSA